MDFIDKNRLNDFQTISRSKMRELVKTKQTLPEGYMDLDAWNILVNYYNNL